MDLLSKQGFGVGMGKWNKLKRKTYRVIVRKITF